MRKFFMPPEPTLDDHHFKQVFDLMNRWSDKNKNPMWGIMCEAIYGVYAIASFGEIPLEELRQMIRDDVEEVIQLYSTKEQWEAYLQAKDLLSHSRDN